MLRTLVAVCVFVTVARAALPAYCGVSPYENAKFYQKVPVPPLSASSTSSSTANAVLTHVQVIMRHGDRTPAFAERCYENDPTVWDCELGWYTVSSFNLNSTSQNEARLFRQKPIAHREVFLGDCLVGQLTDEGYLQHLSNGEAFAEAYVGKGKLLDSTFNNEQVYLRSDDSPRTIQSCQAMFTGLYPPSKSGTNESIVDLHYMDENTDNLNPGLCPELAVYEDNWNTSASAQQLYENLTLPTAMAYAEEMGLPFSEALYLVNGGPAQDCYYTHLCHGYQLPENVTQNTWDMITSQQIAYFKSMYSYPNSTAYGRLSMGPLIKEWRMNLMGVLNGTNTYKFQVYTTHDLSVMPFLHALGIMNDEWTPYAGYSIWELYNVSGGSSSSSTDDYAIRIIRYGEEVTVPGCPDVLCPLNTFLSIIEPLIPTTAECAGI